MIDPLFGRRLPDDAYLNGGLPSYGPDGFQVTVPDAVDDAGSYIVGSTTGSVTLLTRHAHCNKCGCNILLDVRDPLWLIGVCEACGRAIAEELMR